MSLENNESPTLTEPQQRAVILALGLLSDYVHEVHDIAKAARSLTAGKDLNDVDTEFGFALEGMRKRLLVGNRGEDEDPFAALDRLEETLGVHATEANRDMARKADRGG